MFQLNLIGSFPLQLKFHNNKSTSDIFFTGYKDSFYFPGNLAVGLNLPLRRFDQDYIDITSSLHIDRHKFSTGNSIRDVMRPFLLKLLSQYSSTGMTLVNLFFLPCASLDMESIFETPRLIARLNIS